MEAGIEATMEVIRGDVILCYLLTRRANSPPQRREELGRLGGKRIIRRPSSDARSQGRFEHR